MFVSNCAANEMGISMNDDMSFMNVAIDEAMIAEGDGEVPIGAVAVIDGEIVARAHNVREATGNPLGHAEILLIRKLVELRSDWRMNDVTIYVTCEPCVMCAGAMIQARIGRVVFGCRDPKGGAVGSLYDIPSDERLNHRIEVSEGVLSEKCAALLSSFFRKLRSER